MNRRHSLILALSLFAFGGSIAIAAPLVGDFGEPPRLIPYAGVLEEGGVPVSASVEMTFFLVGNVADTEAQALWSETQTVLVSAGRFGVTLGGDSAIADTVFDRTELYAGVSIAGVELAGRQRITTTPYAVTAANAENFTVRSTLTVNGATNLNNGLEVDGLAVFDDAAEFGNATEISSNGNIELGGSGTPTLDFKNDTTTNFDARLSLEGNDLLAVQGARLETENGLRLADGSDFDAPQTLDCQCTSVGGSVSPVISIVTATLPAGYTRTGGGCSSDTASIKIFENSPSGSDSWVCAASLDNGLLPNVLGRVTGSVCGCRLQ